MPEQQREKSLKLGRTIVIAMIAALLFLSAFLISLQGETLNRDVIRWILSVALFVAVYRGQNWARILTAILLAISGVLLAFAADGVDYLLPVLAIVYGASASLLLFHPSVKIFLEHQRNVYKRQAA